ncbi:MAG: 23S rRNA (guanosine(2251)-2'-O)-methyltransferase RlmB [Melioribacteraceae bacterium]|nr:23S rRNA (guanosine(2251)-2'-O)-methyltransferase RlmB [Melioribacteraceae bacterium]MCF8354275.1 23S rRNA (guanosine(2251)-2'-O)-methyltransferase RlmB [Melioribacteraceae bacterium]MCF8394593.1 23S rRNA (guanosine(2251)-2'-O)-methyltransferase RlmB [Melioribacteraceae bacterium]MCF8419738.1 23S rRNA (guanosine(2251)-2'-O)-methyltransferase RlmB [Melioribacteraceae bacterium]
MQFIIGRKPVIEALESDIPLEQIYISFGQQGSIIYKIKNLAKKKGIKFSELSTKKFKEIEKGKNSQGIIAIKSSQNYYSLEEIISSAKSSKFPLLLLLDSIQDPHNVGAILRTAEASGVDGVIITTHNSAPITETVEKTSAGALSHLKICKVHNLNQAIKQIKDEGFWVVGSYLSERTQHYTEVDYKMPVGLIVGNEEKGLHKLVAENCDFLVSIPMLGKIQSLNVSVATGVILYEIVRQRNTVGKPQV